MAKSHLQYTPSNEGSVPSVTSFQSPADFRGGAGMANAVHICPEDDGNRERKQV